MVGLLLISLFLAIFYALFLAPSSKSFSKDKIVALTFDDGPNNGDTQKLLDILKKHKVKATFFVVGNNAKRHPELVKRIKSDGHLLGAHSMRHAFRDYFWPNYFNRQMLPAIKIIEEISGQKINLVRMPWLFRAPWLTRQAKLHGLTIVRGVFGNNNEIFQPKADKIAKTSMAKIKPGLIYIFHDGYNAKGGHRTQTVEAIDLIIPKMQLNDYEAVGVDRLLAPPDVD